MSLAMGTAKYGPPSTRSPNLLGGILGGVTGFLTGGPGGAVLGAITGAAAGGHKTAPAPMPINTLPRQQLPVIPSPGIGGAVQRLLPGGKTGYQVNAPQANGAPPRGMRLNKSGYFLRDGTYVAPGTKYVKIRRRNSMNPRALSRALSRLNGAKRLQDKLRGFSTDKYTSAGKRKSCAA